MISSAISTRGVRTCKLGVCCVLIGLLTPQVVCGQAPAFEDSLDAWRANLNVRLDKDLAELTAGGRVESSTPLIVTWDVQNSPRPKVTSLPGPTITGGGSLLSTVAAILRQEGLPAELVAVARVESGLNPAALSPKGALGLWQLMPDTARRYGLVVDANRDERLDALKSTHAAAKYLRQLYLQFQDWPLTLAAYNTGEDRVQAMLQRFRAHDFWTLSGQFAVPNETRRYVPAVLANMGISALGLRVPSGPQ